MCFVFLSMQIWTETFEAVVVPAGTPLPQAGSYICQLNVTLFKKLVVKLLVSGFVHRRGPQQTMNVSLTHHYCL